MVQHRPRRVALLTAVGGVAASCTAAAASILSRIWNPPRNPDPGNRRLHVLAAEAGWTPWQKLSMGYIRSWTKPIAGKQSFIGLNPHFNIHDVNVTESGTPRSYSLTGST